MNTPYFTFNKHNLNCLALEIKVIVNTSHSYLTWNLGNIIRQNR